MWAPSKLTNGLRAQGTCQGGQGSGRVELSEHLLLALLTEATEVVEKKHIGTSTSLNKKKSSPASLGEHDNGTGAAFEGGFHGAYGDRLCGVAGQVGDATELLKHLPVEHGSLGLTGNLFEEKPRRPPLNDRSSTATERPAKRNSSWNGAS